MVVDEVSPTDPAQAVAAVQLMNEPHIMPAIVQGTISVDGMLLLNAALNSPTLKDHYAAIALKCLKNASARTLPLNEWNQRLKNAQDMKARRRSGENGRMSRGVLQVIDGVRNSKTLSDAVKVIANRREADQLKGWINKADGISTYTPRPELDVSAWLKQLRDL